MTKQKANEKNRKNTKSYSDAFCPKQALPTAEKHWIQKIAEYINKYRVQRVLVSMNSASLLGLIPFGRKTEYCDKCIKNQDLFPSKAFFRQKAQLDKSFKNVYNNCVGYGDVPHFAGVRLFCYIFLLSSPKRLYGLRVCSPASSGRNIMRFFTAG